MAISSETSSVTYSGNNSTVTAYTLAFPFSGSTEIVVTHITAAGVRAVLAITTGYTLQGDPADGTGTLKTVAAIPVADSLLIERFTSAVQSLDSSSPAGSYPTSIETQLDRTTRAVQDNKRIATRHLARSLRVPDGETAAELPAAAARKGEVVYFHATTGAVETKTPVEIFALADAEFAADVDTAVAAAAAAAASEAASAASETAAEAAAIAAAAIIQGPIKVTEYGAVGDGKRVDNVAITGTALTSAGTNFTGLEGKFIRVEGAGVAAADLVTTIATGANGSCTVTLAASTPIASGGTAFYGTNDTVAVQTAIDAAKASSYTRTVFFPPGVYLVNLTMYRELELIGAGSGQNLGVVPTSANLADRDIIPTVLLPALATAPVVAFVSAFGSTLRRMAVAGSAAQNGVGVRVGPDTGAGYFGHGCLIDELNISGFEHGLTVRHVNAVIGTIQINDADYGVWFGPLTSGGAGGKIDIGYMATHNVGRVFSSHASTSLFGITVGAADWNFPVAVADIREDCIFVGHDLNYESNTGDAFNLYGVRSVLDISGINHLNTPPHALVANHGGSTKVRVAGLIGGQGQIYKTTGIGYPELLDRSMVIRRYAAADWASLIETEYASHAYQATRPEAFGYRLSDEFASRYSASPYSDLGWTVTTISGSASTIRAAATPTHLGTLEIASPSTGATNAYRFALPDATFDGNGGFWEMEWVVSNVYLSTTIWRCGMFSLNAALVPTSGIGFRVDRSLGTPDANVMFVIINGGVETAVDTGVAYTELNTAKQVIIRRTALGFTCVIKNMSSRVPLAAEVVNAGTIPAVFLAPACYVGTASTNWIQTQLSRFKLRQLTAD